MPIPVVDLFAGPGGLGEGFTSFRATGTPSPFRIVLSVEKEKFAYRTLRLRSYFRAAARSGRVPQAYYDYVTGTANFPYSEASKDYWEESGDEAQCLEIGEAGSGKLHDLVSRSLGKSKEWVLIGGPPCQAYSLVGRARNAGNENYKAESDGRHFLYKHYLELIRCFNPALFVMENVKGLLSSRVDDEGMFSKILKDLHDPGSGRRSANGSPKYNIHSVVTEDHYGGPGKAPLDPKNFVVATEKYGVPQKRHRVILLGIREDIDDANLRVLRPSAGPVTVREAIGDLSRLRSGLSKADSNAAWTAAVADQAQRAATATKGHFPKGEQRERILAALEKMNNASVPKQGRGGRSVRQSHKEPSEWARRLMDARLGSVLNHEARNHMPEDFARYLFCAAYGGEVKYSPRARTFPPDLAPSHSSWLEGFADRFRVQLWDEPSTTITSHIHKDGHYYIHPDVTQCRTLTVREAARLQTFPDNYFFEGTRTEQYIQVGNAVPPMLARGIAGIVWKLLGH